MDEYINNETVEFLVNKMLGVMLWVFIFAVVGYVVFYLWRHYGKPAADSLLKSLEPKETPAPAPIVVSEKQAITSGMKHLNTAIDRLNRDNINAVMVMRDVNTYLSEMVKLIGVVTRKADSMIREAKAMSEATEIIEALAKGNDDDAFAGSKLATAAGHIRDRHLADMMRLDTKSTAYWVGVHKSLSGQAASLETWAREYEIFVGGIMADLSNNKSMLTELKASQQLAKVAGPMMLASAKIVEAEALLSNNGRYEVGATAGALPTVAFAGE